MGGIYIHKLHAEIETAKGVKKVPEFFLVKKGFFSYKFQKFTYLCAPIKIKAFQRHEERYPS